STGTSTGLQSSVELHGRAASEIGEASLRPTWLAATRRQAYLVPLASPASCTEGSAPAATSMTVGQVAPPSGEHSTCVLVVPAGAAALITNAALRAFPPRFSLGG